jgi:hypothetical protein
MRCYPIKAAFIVQPYYIAGKIAQSIAAGVASRNRHSVNGRASSRFSKPVQFSHDKLVMLEKAFVAIIVRQVALA